MDKVSHIVGIKMTIVYLDILTYQLYHCRDTCYVCITHALFPPGQNTPVQFTALYSPEKIHM